jgi:hypothetical protein
MQLATRSAALGGNHDRNYICLSCGTGSYSSDTCTCEDRSLRVRIEGGVPQHVVNEANQMTDRMLATKCLRGTEPRQKQ